MESSAKKIQRAWKNYRTKKLIKSYSSNITKFKPSLDGGASLTSSQNSKSLFFKKKKLPNKTLNRCH